MAPAGGIRDPLDPCSSSADDQLVIFFLFFPRKQDLTFHAICLHWRQSA